MGHKTMLKLLIGLSVVTAATAVVTVGVLKELQELKALSINSDDLADDLLEAGAYDDSDDVEGEVLSEIEAIEAVEAAD